MGRKKIKRILIPIIAVVVAAAIGAGCWFYFSQKGSEPVNVYSFLNLGMTEYWGDQQESYGPVTTENVQTVFLTSTQTVTEIHVDQGDTVKKGDLLMTFDTTLTDISLERKRLELEQLQLDLKNALKELSEIKAMKPMVIPEAKPQTPTAPDIGTPLSGAYQISQNSNYDGSSRDKALICWLGSDTAFSDDVLDAIAAKAIAYRTPTEPEPTEPAEPTKPGAPTEPEPPTDPEPPTEPEAPTDPETPTEPEAPTDPETPTEPEAPTDPETPTEPVKPVTPPADPVKFYVVIKVTEGNTSKGTPLTWQGLSVNRDSNGKYTYWFYDASAFADHTVPAAPAPEPEPEIDFGSGLTAAQIAELRAQQEKTIRDLQFQIKMAEADYKIMQTEVTDGSVYADLDGTVVSLLTPEEAKLNMQPLMKVPSGGGFYVDGSVGELQKDNLQIGQEVTVNDWNTGMTYTGTVREISDYPLPDDGGMYGNGNPNVSQYPFTVYIDDSADLQAGSYVSVMYSAASVQSGIYLENPYLRTELGKSYVYVKGADGLLEKRFVTTGKSLWGSYTEILEGLTAEDFIAFPYGKNVNAGAETREADISELYSY